MINCSIHVVLATDFGKWAISMCSCVLFLVIEQTGSDSFRDSSYYVHDQLCCLSGVVFIAFLKLIFHIAVLDA